MNIKKIGIILLASCSLLSGCGSVATPSTDIPDKASEVVETEKEIAEDLSESKKTFSMTGLDGSVFNESEISKYDITIVNYWAMYCPHCLDEMAALQEWTETLDANINFIGVVSALDYNKDNERVVRTEKEILELAPTILEENGAFYKNYASNDSFKDYIGFDVRSFPTTFFIDRDGNVVNNSIMNYASVNLYKKALEEYSETGAIKTKYVVDEAPADSTYYQVGETFNLENGERVTVALDENGQIFGILEDSLAWYYANKGMQETEEEKEAFNKQLTEVTRELPRR